MTRSQPSAGLRHSSRAVLTKLKRWAEANPDLIEAIERENPGLAELMAIIGPDYKFDEEDRVLLQYAPEILQLYANGARQNIPQGQHQALAQAQKSERFKRETLTDHDRMGHLQTAAEQHVRLDEARALFEALNKLITGEQARGL